MIIPWGTDAPIYHRPFATIALIADQRAAPLRRARGMPTTDYVLVIGDGVHPVQWLTNNFLHSGIFHLVGNMIFLWTFGLVVEGKLGWWRFPLVYLLLGVVDSAAMQLLVPSEQPDPDAGLLDDHLRADGDVPGLGASQRGDLHHLAAVHPDRARPVDPLVRRDVHRTRRAHGGDVGRPEGEPDEPLARRDRRDGPRSHLRRDPGDHRGGRDGQARPGRLRELGPVRRAGAAGGTAQGARSRGRNGPLAGVIRVSAAGETAVRSGSDKGGSSGVPSVEDRSAAMLRSMRQHLELGEPEAALAVYQKARRSIPAWQPPEAGLARPDRGAARTANCGTMRSS